MSAEPASQPPSQPYEPPVDPCPFYDQHYNAGSWADTRRHLVIISTDRR